MTNDQIRTLRTVAAGIIEACEPSSYGAEIGAPGGVLYAALMAKGCTLSQFESITGGLVRGGMLTFDGGCYTATDKGRAFAASVPA